MPPRATHLAADAREAVATHGLDVAPVLMQQRAAYGHALTAGQTAQEYEPDGKGAEEIGKLFEWLTACLALAVFASLPTCQQNGNMAIQQLGNLECQHDKQTTKPRQEPFAERGASGAPSQCRAAASQCGSP